MCVHSSQLHFQWPHACHLKSAMMGALHHRKWQTLSIRDFFFFPFGKAAVEDLPLQYLENCESKTLWTVDVETEFDLAPGDTDPEVKIFIGCCITISFIFCILMIWYLCPCQHWKGYPVSKDSKKCKPNNPEPIPPATCPNYQGQVPGN